MRYFRSEKSLLPHTPVTTLYLQARLCNEGAGPRAHASDLWPPACSFLSRVLIMRSTLLLRFLPVVSAALVASFTTGVAHAEDARPPKGFVALFNGKDLTGWHGMP